MPNAQDDSPGSAGARTTSGVQADRDALVVGALYGELTPAEQAQLSAHLETNPGDRAALEELRATRQMVRDSRFLDEQVDPPQSVSALLLQEAARRAPKRDAEQGWFARFVAAFVAHPALASVASLVLVVGVASTLYVRNGNELAAERPVAQSPSASEVPSSATAAAPAEESEGAAPRVTGASASDGVRVDLDDTAEQGKGTALPEGKMGDAAPTKERAAQPKGARELAKDTAPKAARAKSDSLGKSLTSDDRKKALPKADAPAAKKSVRSVAPESSNGPSGGAVRPGSASESATSDKAETVASGAMRNTSSMPLRRSEPSAALAADSEAAASETDEAPVGKFATPPRPSAPVAAPRQAASGAPAPASPSDGRAYGSADSAKQQAQSSAWTRSTHQRVLALVKAGKCQEASPFVQQLRARDPGYYAANVATDRSLAPCLARIAAAERDAKSRKVEPAKAGVAQ